MNVINAALRKPKATAAIGCLVLLIAFFACGAIQLVLDPTLSYTRTPTATVPTLTPTITRTPAPTNTPEPTRTPRPSRTPTATPTERPTRTATPLPLPTSTGPKNYDANGDGRVTCDDFAWQFQAQEAYDAGYRDLDGTDNDGRACESLP